MKRYLNIGCGKDIMPDAINVDTVRHPGVDVLIDLECEELPFENDSFEAIYAYHVLEHTRQILTVMQELYRVAKPGCHLSIRCPHAGTNDAYDDPTHVRVFTESSWTAYSQPYYWRAVYRTLDDVEYSADWKCIGVQLLVPNIAWPNDTRIEDVLAVCRANRNQVVEMRADLIAVKPGRERLKELQVPYPVDVAGVEI